MDLNPHQLEAAVFAIDSLSRGGCMLADEVGLGKTIEAGIVIAQLVAEGKQRILVLAPATLRAQWQAELKEKFDLDSMVVDGRTVRATGNCFDQPAPIVIASHPFAAGRAELLAQLEWDLVVIDEAHRLRNAHKPGNKTGKALKLGLKTRPSCCSPPRRCRTSSTELFGLMSLLDEQILGPEEAFRAHFPVDPENGGLTESASKELKARLSPVVQRTLRRQVKEYVRYTNRRSVVEDFTPSPEEQSLYEDVSEYLRRADARAIEPGKKSAAHAGVPQAARLLDVRHRAHAAEAVRDAGEAPRGGEARRARRARCSSSPRRPSSTPRRPRSRTRPGRAQAARNVLASMEREVWELQQVRGPRRLDSGERQGRGAQARAGSRLHRGPRAPVAGEGGGLHRVEAHAGVPRSTCSRRTATRGRSAKLTGDAGTPEARRALVEDFRERRRRSCSPPRRAPRGSTSSSATWW